jgi:hypothetical protein
MLEVLHQQGEKFKQLFVIQFQSFFVRENSIRFSKDQIDGICKDIRYPNDFFVDLIFDEDKNQDVSIYDSEVANWKSVMSDFIMKSYKSNNNSKEIEEININKNINEEKNNNINNNTTNNNSIRTSGVSNITSSSSETDKDEDVTEKPNTINKAEKILQQYSKDNKNTEQEDEDEEDMEDYFRKLENKTK